jgi:hypothetical protein
MSWGLNISFSNGDTKFIGKFDTIEDVEEEMAELIQKGYREIKENLHVYYPPHAIAKILMSQSE